MISLFVFAPVASKNINSMWKFACMWLRDCAFLCAHLCVYLFVWVIGSSYVFHLSRYWGEWQGVKLKLHPLSEHHNPHLCSSFSKCWFAHQNPNGVCVHMDLGLTGCKRSSLCCMSLCVCVCICLKLWGYLAHLSANNTVLKSDSFRSLT